MYHTHHLYVKTYSNSTGVTGAGIDKPTPSSQFHLRKRSRLPPRLSAHDACCDQVRSTKRLRDVAVGRCELHDLPCIRNLDSCALDVQQIAMHIDLRNRASIQDGLPPPISVREILHRIPDPRHIRLGTHHNDYRQTGSPLQRGYVNHIKLDFILWKYTLDPLISPQIQIRTYPKVTLCQSVQHLYRPFFCQFSTPHCGNEQPDQSSESKSHGLCVTSGVCFIQHKPILMLCCQQKTCFATPQPILP